MRVVQMGINVTLRPTPLVVLSLFLYFSLAVFAQECSQCTAVPPSNCEIGDTPPISGGPPCSCVRGATLAGCVLKPCENQGQLEPCDSSAGPGSVDQRVTAYSHKCTGREGECECCKTYPSDCTTDNLLNPPAWGGQACSCTTALSPAGCVLKPCKENTDKFCVCNSDSNGLHCFASICPGNEDDAVTENCPAGSTDSTTDATTITDATTSDGGGDTNGESKGASVKVSIGILFVGIASTFTRM